MRIIFSTNNNGKLKEVREILRDKGIANDNEVLSLGDIGIDLSPEETGKTYEENARIKAMACKDAMINKNLYRKDDMIIADDSGLSVDYLDGAPGIYSARFGEIKAGSHCFAPTITNICFAPTNTGSQGFAPTKAGSQCFAPTEKTNVRAVNDRPYKIKMLTAPTNTGSQCFAPTNTGSQCFAPTEQRNAPTDKCHYLLDLMKDVDKENRKAKFICVLCVIIEEDIKYYRGEMEGSIAFEMSGDSGFGYDPVFIPKGYDNTVAQLSDDEKNKISHRAKALINFVDCVFKKC